MFNSKVIDEFLAVILKDLKLRENLKAKQGYLRDLSLYIFASQATSGPPLGLILGQYAINTASFCKQFNEISKYLDNSILVQVKISLFVDKSYLFYIEKPTLSFLIKAFLFNLKTDKLGINEVLFLAKFKFPKISIYNSLPSICATIKSMRVNLKI